MLTRLFSWTKHEAGQATLIVLAVGVLLLGISLGLFLTTKSRLSTLTNQGASIQARALAEAGVVAAEFQIESCLTTYGCSQNNFSGSGSLHGVNDNYSYTATLSSINATGTYGNAQRQITADVSFPGCSPDQPKSCTWPPTVSSWRDN